MKPKIGDTFVTKAVLRQDHRGSFFSNFDLNPKFKKYYGLDENDRIVDVKCTITDVDLSISLMILDVGYDDNCIDYIAYLPYGKEPRIIMPNIKLFMCCFPYSPFDACYHNKKKIATICRLKVEQINK